MSIARREIRKGSIYIICDVPDPTGTNPKERPAVLLETPPKGRRDIRLLLAPVTTSTTDPARILLPNLAQDPRCATGLREVSFVIPALWLINVRRAALERLDPIGYISRHKLTQIIEAARECEPGMD